MKRFALVLAAAAFMASPALPASADPPPGRGHNPHAEGRHDNGLHRGWDRQRFNGYTYRGEWHYGPPPDSLADAVELGFRMWRRGDRLPDYYRSSLGAVDYRAYGLDPPPRGAHYVRDDQGNYLLVGIATGIILGVIIANN